MPSKSVKTIINYIMASYPQQKLMTDILNISGFMVKEYRFIEEVGLVLYLENLASTVTCPNCGAITDKLHQNYQGFRLGRQKTLR